MPPGTFLTSSRKTFLGGLIAFFSWATEKCLGTFLFWLQCNQSFAISFAFVLRIFAPLNLESQALMCQNPSESLSWPDTTLFFCCRRVQCGSFAAAYLYFFSLLYRSEAAHVKHVRCSGTRKTVQAGIFVLCLFRYPKSLIRIGET